MYTATFEELLSAVQLLYNYQNKSACNWKYLVHFGANNN